MEDRSGSGPDSAEVGPRAGDALGEVVRMRREQGGLNQDELQERGGPGEVTVRNIENGRAQPSLKTLAKLDQALNWPAGLASEIAGKRPRRAPLGELLALAMESDTVPRAAPPKALPSRAATTSAAVIEEAARIVNLGTRLVTDLSTFERELVESADAAEIRHAYYKVGVLPDVLNMWFGAMRITGVIDPLREELRHDPMFRDRLRLPPPAPGSKPMVPNDEETRDDRSAPSTQAGGSPAMTRDPDAEKQEEAERLLDELMSQGDYRLAAHEPDDDIEQEQEETEREP
ncbi:helix-turn-helix transcriptional regulator [Cellulomonas cellasea]|uniref:helix-turn-helix domain-containing protein n=1 Tax=Cellulomonas cellasea TaxID=43670 RepID=UPI0025A313C2|nr:helix-turn-helix transcriptional regulator [Cellulomonas cellasea]MDM8086311.1 helix-turn-helix transcriptional regulator [Cellulomonas cellasea]